MTTGGVQLYLCLKGSKHIHSGTSAGTTIRVEHEVSATLSWVVLYPEKLPANLKAMHSIRDLPTCHSTTPLALSTDHSKRMITSARVHAISDSRQTQNWFRFKDSTGTKDRIKIPMRYGRVRRGGHFEFCHRRLHQELSRCPGHEEAEA